MVKNQAESPKGSSTTDAVTVVARPDRIAVGGIVLVTATVDSAVGDGPFDVEWTVEGPDVPAGGNGLAMLGATTITGNQVTLDHGHGLDEIRGVIDTSQLTIGSWRVAITLTPVVQTGKGAQYVYEGLSDPVDVLPRPLGAGEDISVALRRTSVPPTADQALWVAVRRSTRAIDFEHFDRFMNRYVCGEPGNTYETTSLGGSVGRPRTGASRIALPFPRVDSYRVLKAATSVFLMANVGTRLDDFRGVDLAEESRRLNREVRRGDLEEEFRDYLTRVPTGTGDTLDVLPYLGLIRLKLGDVPVVGADDDEESVAAEICHGILAEKLVEPTFLELIWSYWQEEGMLVRTINAISRRFQNRRSGPGRDPLAGLAIDPLRPLNNLLWGWIQDAQHRLSSAQRAREYQHELGAVLGAMHGPPVQVADSRSRFFEAFHNLLSHCEEFYRRDDDVTVVADGFGVLNALKETHLLLSQGAHNQYGDLPWTARQEMLMIHWILSRPEMGEFLPTRTMVAYPEPWMDRVDAMAKLQGWSDTSVVHFRDLAVFGEQLLLGIRFGAWSTVIDPEQASNWARYFRAEVKGYSYAYGAVTGIDLSGRGDPSASTFHQRRRQGYYR